MSTSSGCIFGNFVLVFGNFVLVFGDFVLVFGDFVLVFGNFVLDFAIDFAHSLVSELDFAIVLDFGQNLVSELFQDFVLALFALQHNPIVLVWLAA